MNMPVLIICYKRVVNVCELLRSVCEQGVSRVYLAIDGSKDNNSSVSNLIELESKQIAKEFNVDLRIWKRETNLGPAVSVISAIDWLFKTENSGIILEDDLVISPQLLEYFEVMTQRFESNQDVMMLSGTQFVSSRNSDNFLWASYPVIWGWATWSNRWKFYRDQLSQLERVNVNKIGKEKRFWKTGVRRCASGIQDAWDIPFAVCQLSSGKKTILPPVNLISNHGADEFAGNTVFDAWPLGMEIHTLPSDYLRFSLNFKDPDSSLDEFIRSEVYNLSDLRVLPQFFSRLVDYFRFPLWSRRFKLNDRLTAVSLPD